MSTDSDTRHDQAPLQKYGVRIYAKAWDLEIEVFERTAENAVSQLRVALEAAGEPTLAHDAGMKRSGRG